MTTDGTITLETSLNGSNTMELSLYITDTELQNALSEYRDDRERHDFAVSALKIGAIALRQAQGRIDAEEVRREGDRFIENMGHILTRYQHDVTEQINTCLKNYFDPDSGQFNERVKRLVENDGELERVIRGQIGSNGSELSRTLAVHVGPDSLLMHKLDPKSTDGLINLLVKSTEGTLSDQRELILREFSLDNSEGALNRMVGKLTKNHGEVGEALENRIESVMGEFSLDKEDSALSHMVNQVNDAQRKISSEFSLDNEDSALVKIRKELLDVIGKQHQTNEEFQREVIRNLTDMTARKQESEKGTRHGLDFEEAVFDFINEQCQKAGDVATRTGNTTGRTLHSKKGDVVIKLGPEHVAAGAQIVVEAKQDASYTPDKALSELDEARKNRDAGIGLFVFSERTAQVGIDPFSRYGENIVIVWNAEDPASNVVFDAGLSVAKALSVQAKSYRDEVGADFEEIEKAISEIERQVGGLDEITKSAEAIENHTGKILNRCRIMRNGLNKQIGILNEEVGDLRQVISSTP